MPLNFSTLSSQTFHYILFINSNLRHLPHHLHLNKASSLPLLDTLPCNFPLPLSSSLPSLIISTSPNHPHHLQLILRAVSSCMSTAFSRSSLWLSQLGVDSWLIGSTWNHSITHFHLNFPSSVITTSPAFPRTLI